MSFVSATRDYIEIMTNMSTSLGTDFSPQKFIIETLFYIAKSLQHSVIYTLSFQWLRDFTLLPIIIPQITKSIFKEGFFLETPSTLFFEFLEIPNFEQNKFLVGFFNSFFLNLPISVIHIISVRRLIIQGIPAGFFSIAGYICGQLVFLTTVIFGIRSILIPWLTLEPLTFIIGLIVIFRVVYRMTRENLVKLPGWQNPRYKNFFLASFLVALCEQTSVFQYLGNLTLNQNPTLLESFPTDNVTSSILTHTNYLLGILIGSIIFSCFWGWFFLQLKNLVIAYTPLFLSRFIQTLNKATFILAVSLSLTSIPFYGFDYLITGPLGFISQDHVFKNTVFDQYYLKDLSGAIAGPGSTSIDVEVSPFDRGKYLLSREGFSFEDLNYRGEADWINRLDKLSTISDSRAGVFTLAKIFKKQKLKQTAKELASQETTLEKMNSLVDENSSNDLVEYDSSVISKRFSDWYDLASGTQEDKSYETTFDDLSKVSSPGIFIDNPFAIEKNIEKKIKAKYYSNPVYKNLLGFDIDLFLKRQPRNFNLTNSNEADLFNKRQMLVSYYDSLREYSKLPYNEKFETFFDGSKSFTNKVYNQQYKGTLRSVRRLFLLTLNSAVSPLEQKELNQKVLKFDQPLYDLQSAKKFSSYHEELAKTKSNETKKSQAAFLKDVVNKPLYAGWDTNLRKFVITNKLLSRKLAGYKVNLRQEMIKKFSPDKTKEKNVNDKKSGFASSTLGSQKIKFTIWPLSKKILAQPKVETPIPYVTLYQSKKDLANPKDSHFENFETLPSNWLTYIRANSPVQNFDDIFYYLVPKRGGFLWPGDAPLDVKSMLPSANLKRFSF